MRTMLKSKKFLENDCCNQPHFPPRSAYMCGKDLSPNVPLAWLKAMPDAAAVVRARKESYEGNEKCECEDVEKNTKSYTQVHF